MASILKENYKKYRDWQKNRKRQKKEQGQLKKRVAFYSQFVQSDSLCFDVGANVGNRTETFLLLGARVIAVEPQSACLEVLHQRFDQNKDVVLVPKGLDKDVGESKIFSGDTSTISSMSQEWISSVQENKRFPGHNWNKSETIQTTTLDSLIQEYGLPVFCKIDVEGFEYQVLQGLSQPLPMVSLEFIPEGMETTENCINHLCSLGTCSFNYAHGEDMNLTLTEWVNRDELLDILNSYPKNTDTFGDIYVRSQV